MYTTTSATYLFLLLTCQVLTVVVVVVVVMVMGFTSSNSVLPVLCFFLTLKDCQAEKYSNCENDENKCDVVADSGRQKS